MRHAARCGQTAANTYAICWCVQLYALVETFSEHPTLQLLALSHHNLDNTAAKALGMLIQVGRMCSEHLGAHVCSTATPMQAACTRIRCSLHQPPYIALACIALPAS